MHSELYFRLQLNNICSTDGSHDMNANSQKILTALVLLALTVSCTARRCPLLHANEGTNRTGCYIVVLHRATTQERFTEILKRVSSMADGSKVSGVVRTVSKAFTVKLSAYSLNLVRVFCLLVCASICIFMQK